MPDGRSVPVFVLVNATAARRFLLTNPDGYSLTYNGLVMVVEKRRSNGWQAFGSYTLSRAYGLQPSSGTTAAGAQVSTVGSAAPTVTFGRDPNDLDQRARPAAKRSPAHVPGRWAASTCRVPASWSPPICSTSAASRGRRRRRLSLPQNTRAAHPARAARLAPAVVADAARRAGVEDDLLRRSGTHRVARGRAQCAQRHGGGGLATDNLFSSNFGRPSSSWIRAARWSA